MDKINDGGPAFPEGERWFTTDHYGAKEEHARGVLRSGMTLRDYFAAKALPATLQDYHAGLRSGEYGCDPDWAMGVAIDAYRLADAMLRAREAQSATPSPAPASPSRDALQALPLCHAAAGDLSTTGTSA